MKVPELFRKVSRMTGGSGEHLYANMIGSVARRSLNASGAEHVNIRALAAARGEFRAMAAQQPKDRVNEHRV